MYGGRINGIIRNVYWVTLINLADISCVPIKTFLCISPINGSFCHLILANFSEGFFLLGLNL